MPSEQSPADSETPDFGPNAWIVEDTYQRYLEAPDSVSDEWRAHFEGRPVTASDDGPPPKAPPPPQLAGSATADGARAAGRPDRSSSAATSPPPPTAPAKQGPAPAPVTDEAPGEKTATGAQKKKPAPAAKPAARKPAAPNAISDLEDEQLLRGGAAIIAERMDASRDLPTATSVRTFPAKLLEVNRRIINNQLARRPDGGKVSFTHLIGWAVIQALKERPAMNAAYRVIDGKPHRIDFNHINLGLAMDLERKDGSRTLLVPNLKLVDEMGFRDYWLAYEDVVRRARAGQITPDDFAETTATLTNPGTVGTVQSIPRLMPGQGLIVGVGRIGFPPEYEGADPQTIANFGIGRTLTMTSTYDHRIIQGADSGQFLARVHELLLGAEFYDEIFRSMEIPYVPARWAIDANPPPGSRAWAEKQARVFQLINMYRVRGHLMADLDPLRQKPPAIHTELDPLTYGLTLWDLDREFATGGFAGRPRMELGRILGLLRDAYCRTSGIEYMHIQEPDQKLWLQQHAEVPTPDLPDEDKVRILRKLEEGEAFERFLHTKFLGAKRFSLEGSESLIPLLDALLTTAADSGVEDVAIGMSHRGRLNVLANIVNKPLPAIFREFVGFEDPDESNHYSGDVKYHLGAKGRHETPDGRTITVEVVANPSHLEAVDPVLEGITRAKQDARGSGAQDEVLPVLLHGDAAFSGQGVVAETFNLSQLRGYFTGGTVHVVVNNQVGFTTSALDARSTFYATDVAKAVQAPIFHVNADDPEAVVRIARMAFAFREAFHKDVVIDLVCYRRLGHNEGDEPSYTQPKMYRIIDKHPSVRKIYGDRLIQNEVITEEAVSEMVAEFRAALDHGLDTAKTALPKPRLSHGSAISSIGTRIDTGRLAELEQSLSTLPEGFTVHPKIEKLLSERTKLFAAGEVDWAMAEALAFGSLSLEGIRVRLAGEDSQRGTFSHRHAVLVDYETEDEYMPLQHLHPDQAPVKIYDSLLSEFAAMGFEYGYSVAAPEALVMWEAQFGDFVNGAQVVIDQFLASGMDKWDQTSGVVLLLPHGYEGQGPEHSSGRLERFLTNAAEDNLRIMQPSTPAQFFHMLRLQARHPEKRPLVVMTPKSLLRTRDSFSPVELLSKGTFQAVIPDDKVSANARRVLLCTGKIYYDLLRHREKHEIDDVAIVRMELLYPFPTAPVNEALAPHGDTELVWVQEEPANMGAWRYMSRCLYVDAGRSSRGIYRRESASPATGNPKTHAREQRELVEKAFT